MPRKAMVTRTITCTKVLATVCELDTMKIGTMEFLLPRTYKTDKELDKALTKANSNPNIKIIRIDSTSLEETLYGMDEQDFINFAVKLPPRGTKADTENGENGNAEYSDYEPNEY